MKCTQNFDNQKLQKAVNDGRYMLSLEWLGHSRPLHTIRFCGEFVGSDTTVNGAILLAIFHQDERTTKLI